MPTVTFHALVLRESGKKPYTAELETLTDTDMPESEGIKPESGPAVVTGASGGVGSVTIAILARLGYEVHAATDRESAHEYLKKFGACTFLSRADMNVPPRTLESTG